MAKINETAENLKGPNEEKPSSARSGPGLFAFTIDASTGQIQKVDSSGVRRQLSEQDQRPTCKQVLAHAGSGHRAPSKPGCLRPRKRGREGRGARIWTTKGKCGGPYCCR